MPSFDRQVPACILQYQHMIHGLHEGKFKIDRLKHRGLVQELSLSNTKSVFCVCFHADVGLFPQD